MAHDDATTPIAGRTPTAPGEPGVEEELAPGALAGAWRVEGLLARGGHGVVYVAAHRDSGRRAALKVLQRKYADVPGMATRFVREGVLLSRLRHPAVCEYLELGLLPDGRPFCAMELLVGRTLQEVLRDRGRLSPAESLALLGPVCDALDAAHGAGVVHRDVKSSNVFIVAGDPPSVKLLDFGVAKPTGLQAEALTAVGERIGSAHAMSPEQIRGEAVDPRTDVYALGVLLHQMLTGTPPFSAADPIELERLHLEAPPPPPGRLAPVPPSVDAVTTRALAKRPADRFPSAAGFVGALRAAVEGDVAGERDAAGVGVHVAVLAAEPDEASALVQATLEAEAEQALSSAGFSVDVRAPGTLLATRLLPEGAAARSERARAVALARALAERLAADAGAAAAVRVSVHAADVRLAADGARRVGGALFRAADWVRPRDDVFDATPAALA